MAQDKSWKIQSSFYVHQCLALLCSALFYCLSMIDNWQCKSTFAQVFFANPLQQPFCQSFYCMVYVCRTVKYVNLLKILKIQTDASAHIDITEIKIIDTSRNQADTSFSWYPPGLNYNMSIQLYFHELCYTLKQYQGTLLFEYK